MNVKQYPRPTHNSRSTGVARSTVAHAVHACVTYMVCRSLLKLQHPALQRCPWWSWASATCASCLFLPSTSEYSYPWFCLMATCTGGIFRLSSTFLERTARETHDSCCAACSAAFSQCELGTILRSPPPSKGKHHHTTSVYFRYLLIYLPTMVAMCGALLDV